MNHCRLYHCDLGTPDGETIDVHLMVPWNATRKFFYVNGKKEGEHTFAELHSAKKGDRGVKKQR